MSGIGGSKDGSGVRWYSGRGGRFEKSIMADAVAIWLSLRSMDVLLTRHAAGVGPLRPGSTKAQRESSSEMVRFIRNLYSDISDGEGSEDSVNEKQRSV